MDFSFNHKTNIYIFYFFYYDIMLMNYCDETREILTEYAKKMKLDSETIELYIEKLQSEKNISVEEGLRKFVALEPNMFKRVNPFFQKDDYYNEKIREHIKINEIDYTEQYLFLNEKLGWTYSMIEQKVKDEIHKFTGLIDKDGALLLIEKSVDLDFREYISEKTFGKGVQTEQLHLAFLEENEKAIRVMLKDPIEVESTWLPKSALVSYGKSSSEIVWMRQDVFNRLFQKYLADSLSNEYIQISLRPKMIREKAVLVEIMEPVKIKELWIPNSALRDKVTEGKDFQIHYVKKWYWKKIK